MVLFLVIDSLPTETWLYLKKASLLLEQFWGTVPACSRWFLYLKKRTVGRRLYLRPRSSDHRKLVPGKVITAVFFGCHSFFREGIQRQVKGYIHTPPHTSFGCRSHFCEGILLPLGRRSLWDGILFHSKCGGDLLSYNHLRRGFYFSLEIIRSDYSLICLWE